MVVNGEVHVPTTLSSRKARLLSVEYMDRYLDVSEKSWLIWHDVKWLLVNAK